MPPATAPLLGELPLLELDGLVVGVELAELVEPSVELELLELVELVELVVEPVELVELVEPVVVTGAANCNTESSVMKPIIEAAATVNPDMVLTPALLQHDEL
jgi:hypothetical protein